MRAQYLPQRRAQPHAAPLRDVIRSSLGRERVAGQVFAYFVRFGCHRLSPTGSLTLSA